MVEAEAEIQISLYNYMMMSVAANITWYWSISV